MASASSSVSFILIPIILIFSVGLIVLQVFLSKAKNRFLGLILPIISLVIGLFMTISMLVYIGGGISIGSVVLFFMMQIPTIIFMIVYFIVRSITKDNKRSFEKVELEKMDIQDL